MSRGKHRGRRRFATVSFRLALVLVALLGAVLFSEALLRWLGVGGPLQLEPIFDRDEVHYLREAPWKKSHVWVNGPFFRVAVIGDSFTVGQGVNWDNTYPYRLLDLLNLNAATPPTLVRVFARNGYSTMDEVRFLEPALRWRPDLILLGVFLNDPETRQDPGFKASREAMLARPPEGITRTLVRSSRLLELLYERREALRIQSRAGAYQNRLYDPDYRGWKDFETALGIFAERTEATGVPLVAFIFPTMDGLGPGYSRMPHERIGEALASKDILYRDLLDTFSDKSSFRMQVYPGIDAHPSEIAHRIVAREIFDFLLDEGILGEEFRPRAVKKDRTRRQWLRTLRRYRDIAHFPP